MNNQQSKSPDWLFSSPLLFLYEEKKKSFVVTYYLLYPEQGVGDMKDEALRLEPCRLGKQMDM